jgi:uncharacterized Zn finger protein
MTRRVRFERQLFARIQGSYGVYRTWIRLGRHSLDSGCTCPSDWRPCKHVRALAATWRENPSSFFDVGVLLKTLAGRSKAELVETIGRLIARAPEGLAALGIPGFDGEEPDDPDERDAWS